MPKLTRAQRNKVQKIGKMGIEDPRKWFIAVSGTGLTGSETVQAARTSLRGVKRGTSIAEGGQNDRGRLQSSFRDPDLVGSRNDIDEYGGSSFSGGDGEAAGGGGGSGSSLAGRESVGRVGDTSGRSLDEVVYGVKKRGRKVARPRGE